MTVDAKDEYIYEIKEKIAPDYFQLHGNETPARCREIKSKFNIPIIKGLEFETKLILKKIQNLLKTLVI